MCDIGKPLEILNVEPLVLPAPLRKETQEPISEPVTVEVPAFAETETTVELTVERS